MELDTITVLPWVFVAGAGIGVFFFGGLWWTVNRLANRCYPALWVLGSFLFRAALSISVFYWVTEGKWERLAVGLAGFLLVRALMVRRMGRLPVVNR
jgi:F1F0 ATPase subunit 2